MKAAVVLLVLCSLFASTLASTSPQTSDPPTTRTKNQREQN
jgi:hypothetical protein